MNRVAALFVIFVINLWIGLSPSFLLSKDFLWEKVDEGLSIKEFDPAERPKASDPKILIVKIDPKLYSLKLLCASEYGKVRMTVKDWCQKHNLISAINAGMYQEDGLRNVGYMKNFSHINNPRLNTGYQAVLAFNRVDPAVPEIQIIDLKCQDFDRLKPKYETFIQNIRMISCLQENVWVKQNKRWSMAVFGVDKDGNALLIFTETPYSGYDFAKVLLSLPISIYNAMYLEGGQEASLYFSAKGIEMDKIGVPRAEFAEDNDRFASRPVPNVIGVIKKSR